MTSPNDPRRRGAAVTIAGLLVAGLVIPATPAWAAPPDNDDRADATRLDPPQSVRGTLVGATLEPANDESYCGDDYRSEGSVWYRFTAPRNGAIIVQLDAGGELDATVDLYRKVRSRLDFVDCEATDAQGGATLDNDGLEPGKEYAIRVGRQFGSVAAGFDLRLLVPKPLPEPPGKRLPSGGVKDSVDRVANPGDAYWMELTAGRTMRLSLDSDYCTPLWIYEPGTKSFGADPVAGLNCGGYEVFTPARSGRYSFLVEAARSRDIQRYRLQVARAKADDTTPGVFIRNHAKVTGRVNGRIDNRDLYRFDVTSRSTLTLKLDGTPDMKLVRNGGRHVSAGSRINEKVDAGRYYVAVKGKGKYTLKRVSRTITHSDVTFAGRKKARSRPDAAVPLALRVRPAVAGKGRIVVERRDPIDGWQFLRRYRVRVQSGAATVTFDPPSVGRYRARGEFKTTRSAAKSESSFAKLLVRGPLQD